jgi:pyruvate dehydrogenase (quinone)
MKEEVSDFLITRLSEWGVRRIYGYPGDGINGIMGALERHPDKIEFIQVRHEENAAFMACAHAKFTGEVGVCLATSGPGAIHLLNGLYDAKLDNQPVVAIVGQSARMSLGGDYHQEVDLISLFKDVAHEYVHMVSVPEQLRHAVDRSLRIAQNRRCVTCIVIPNDVQQLKAVKTPPRKQGGIHTGSVYSKPQIIPAAEELDRAAAVLNAGKRVALLVGAGALQATDEVIEVAEILGAGIAKALLGKAAVPDDIPYVTGSIGMLGTRPSWEMMESCDTLLMIGSNFPYGEFLPREGQARGVQIDIDGSRLSLRYPMEVNLEGDARLTLRALLPRLQYKENRGWRRQIERSVSDWWRTLERRALTPADPINPQRVFWELSPRLPDNCILTADTGTVAFWYARDLKMRPGMMGSLSGGLATMGPAVPYAVAAKFAHPGRPVIAMAGDGAMQMNGNTELLSIKKYWKRWQNPQLIVAVLNNRDLNMVSWEQRVLTGNPRFEDSQELPDFSYAAYAELIGLKGILVDDPRRVGDAWDMALRADRPTVVEFLSDPAVPPLPPHIKLEQIKEYLKALLKGDAETVRIVKASAREVLK